MWLSNGYEIEARVAREGKGAWGSYTMVGQIAEMNHV